MLSLDRMHCCVASRFCSAAIVRKNKQKAGCLDLKRKVSRVNVTVCHPKEEEQQCANDNATLTADNSQAKFSTSYSDSVRNFDLDNNPSGNKT